jgi:hypothetical protein
MRAFEEKPICWGVLPKLSDWLGHAALECGEPNAHL